MDEVIEDTVNFKNSILKFLALLYNGDIKVSITVRA